MICNRTLIYLIALNYMFNQENQVYLCHQRPI